MICTLTQHKLKERGNFHVFCAAQIKIENSMYLLQDKLMVHGNFQVSYARHVERYKEIFMHLHAEKFERCMEVFTFLYVAQTKG